MTLKQKFRNQFITLVCCIALLSVSLYSLGSHHWLTLAITTGIVLVCLFGPCLTIWQLFSKDKQAFPNATSASWKEMWRLIRAGDSSDYQELLRGMGKELLPWEKRLVERLERIEHYIENTWIGKKSGRFANTFVGVAIGMLIGILISWFI